MDSSYTRSHPKATAGSDTPPIDLLRLVAGVSPDGDADSLGWAAQGRRASGYLIAENGRMLRMERKSGRPSKGPRAAVIFRMPVPLRGQTQGVLDELGLTLNRFVERLAAMDVVRPVPARSTEPRPVRHTGRRGRPSKGPRTTVVLRISFELAEQIKQRTTAGGLSITDYLESLVSQGISAHRAAGEEMVLDQSA